MKTTKLQYHPIGEKAESLQYVIGWWLATLGAFYAWHAGYVLAIKNLSLGKYSFLILGILLALAFLRAVWDYVSAAKKKKIIAKLPKDDAMIVLNDKDFSFPVLNKAGCEHITIPYEVVTQLWTKDDEDEGQSQVIYVNEEYKNTLKKGWFQRFETNFPDKKEYEVFKTTLNEKCTNITNR